MSSPSSSSRSTGSRRLKAADSPSRAAFPTRSPSLPHDPEAIDVSGRTLDLDQDAVGVVENEPTEGGLGGEPVDERPEPDPLHDSFDPQPPVDAPRGIHVAMVAPWGPAQTPSSAAEVHI
jgi:hypothetical protein